MGLQELIVGLPVPSNQEERNDALDDEEMSQDLPLRVLVDTNNVPDTYLPSGPIFKTFLGRDQISDDYATFHRKVLLERFLKIVNELYYLK